MHVDDYTGWEGQHAVRKVEELEKKLEGMAFIQVGTAIHPEVKKALSALLENTTVIMSQLTELTMAMEDFKDRLDSIERKSVTTG